MGYVTRKYLMSMLYYNPNMGIFNRLVTKGGRLPGTIAGYLSPDGYVRIKIKEKTYLAHRLAWLYMEGYWPENMIDHINRIRDDNRRCNLREVSRSCNLRNCDVGKNNKSGITGVYWEPIRRKWRAQVGINGKKLLLGQFNNKIDAVKARYLAEVEYKFPDCNINSSAFLYIKKYDPAYCIYAKDELNILIKED